MDHHGQEGLTPPDPGGAPSARVRGRVEPGGPSGPPRPRTPGPPGAEWTRCCRGRAADADRRGADRGGAAGHVPRPPAPPFAGHAHGRGPHGRVAALPGHGPRAGRDRGTRGHGGRDPDVGPAAGGRVGARLPAAPAGRLLLLPRRRPVRLHPPRRGRLRLPREPGHPGPGGRGPHAPDPPAPGPLGGADRLRPADGGTHVVRADPPAAEPASRAGRRAARARRGPVARGPRREGPRGGLPRARRRHGSGPARRGGPHPALGDVQLPRVGPGPRALRAAAVRARAAGRRPRLRLPGRPRER